MACADGAPVAATVVYLSPQRQLVLPVQVGPGATLSEAVLASGLFELAPELGGQAVDLGVFSRPRQGAEPVQPGDRIEVYRPLAIDPKEARRVRAEVRRRRKAGSPAG
jgi:putative ubiquitin-RnfH superfamily antitoxin RatB of RatAB toxin-antitoxin module